MRKIKSDDEIIVIAGRDKGKRGKVVRVMPNDKVIVAGINIVKKHQKPNPQMGVPGGIVEKEAAINVSNVAIYNAATGKADRIGFKVEGDKKVRVFKSTGEAVGA
ncbi:50S ribosomal protein L24 [Gilvimarinus polysaccharolyticus]|uniref:50S ribosomal protein L24 n=1 Tax=Gilvimarinus polysaccharolyticus TaxID=863921 RepID=UPI000673C072|nr:50S ribosomal protein L24 [Gilvimarinus polysaccharolyticus]